MQLGMIGLGRMGANMTLRLLRGGHKVFAYDRNPQAAEVLAKEGATPAQSIKDLVTKMERPRHVWMMVPSGVPVTETIEELIPILGAWKVEAYTLCPKVDSTKAREVLGWRPVFRTIEAGVPVVVREWKRSRTVAA